ncbi:MAG: mechanosensitive ion channel [Rhodobacteraceae bacterium]|nr:mechanosensitive ion channel [Paracoccaceae bacterium]
MLGRFKIRLLQDWTIYQILIVLALIAVSFLIYRLYKPRIRALLGAPHGWPKWVLRILALVNRRLWLLIFVVLAWATVFGMQEFHRWPSHRYFIQVAASLATAWFLIAITTRLIRNRLIRRLTKWAAWVYVTLEILNLRITARNALDALALEVGETRISALTILTAVVALAALFALAGFLSRTSASRINKIEDMSPSIRVLFIKAVQLGLFIFAFVIGLRVIGFDIGNLALLSGAIGLGIGFGLQKIVSNLVSGVIILLDKSIKPGDVISLEGTFGWITQLGARYASVLTRDGREYLIPNEDFITSQVINWSHSSDLVRLDIKFGVSYDSDPHEVKRIAGKAPLRVKRVVTTPAPVCHMINLGDSSIDFVLRFWIKDSAAGLTNVRGDTYLALWDALAENKIQIPFPRQDITILSQEEPVNPLPEV